MFWSRLYMLLLGCAGPAPIQPAAALDDSAILKEALDLAAQGRMDDVKEKARNLQDAKLRDQTFAYLTDLYSEAALHRRIADQAG